MWKVKHLTSGLYSIRPMHKLDMGLSAPSSDVKLTEIGTTDSLSGIATNSRWKVHYSSTGYVLQCEGSPARTLAPVSNTTSLNALVDAHSFSETSVVQRWTLTKIASPPKGFLLYDTVTGAVVTNPKRNLSVGQTTTLNGLNLDYAVYSGTSISQSVNWTIVTGETVTLNSSSGTMYSTNYGTAVIRLTSQYDTSLKGDYTVLIRMPMSGYELEYEPELWNEEMFDGDNIYEGTNCYAYALNAQFEKNSELPYLWYPAPGTSANSNNTIDDEDINLDDIQRLVQLDANHYGFIFEPIDKYAVCPDNCYKVALLVDEGVDFHWYRQNSDGTWSHKVGPLEVTNKDARDALIYDPEFANNDYSGIGGGNYSDGICFFAISPLNIFAPADSSSTATIPIEDSSTNECNEILMR